MLDQDLFRDSLKTRLEYYLEHYDPDEKFDHQGHVHKTIQLGYQYEPLQPLAFELCIQFFTSIIRQKPLPDWVELLEQALDITKRTHDISTYPRLIICQCYYLLIIENFNDLHHLTKQALQQPDIQKNRATKTDLLIFSSSALLALRLLPEAAENCYAGLNIMKMETHEAANSRRGRLINILGSISYERKSVNDAYTYYVQALGLLEQSGDTYYSNIVRENIIRCLANMNRHAEIWSYQASIQAFYAQHNYTKANNRYLVMLSHIYIGQRNFDAAEEVLFSVDFDYLCQIPPSQLLALYHNNLGYLYFERQAYELAEQQLLGAVNVFRKLGSEYQLNFANSLALLGTTYSKIGRHEDQCDLCLIEAYNLLEELAQAGYLQASKLQKEILCEFPHIRDCVENGEQK